MMHTSTSLYDALNQLSWVIERQIDVVVKDAEQQNIPPTELKYMDGQYVLPDLLLAKAQTLAAMTALKTEKK